MENRELADLITDHGALLMALYSQFNVYSLNHIGEILKWAVANNITIPLDEEHLVEAKLRFL